MGGAGGGLGGGIGKGGQTAEAARVDAISNWLSAHGAMGFIVVGKDSRFIGGVSR